MKKAEKPNNSNSSNGHMEPHSPRPENEISSREKLLLELINPVLVPLGYEAIAAEVHLGRQRKLQLFIDHHREESSGSSGFHAPRLPIGIEDCVQATHALDPALDAVPEVDQIFKGSYELEISSPGVERPLRKSSDFQAYAGERARIHVFRALLSDEIENPDYSTRNPKQKNFLGVLLGCSGKKVKLAIVHEGKQKKKKATEPQKQNTDEIYIPLELISKAHLEPDLDSMMHSKVQVKGNKI